MDHCRPELRLVLTENRHETIVGIAFVHEHGHRELRRNRELRGKNAFLDRTRREIPIEVQTCFSDGYDNRRLCKLPDHRGGVIGPFSGEMRMHTGSRKQYAGILRSDIVGRPALTFAGAGHDHLRDAGRPSALQHLRKIVPEAIVAQIRADIDEFHGTHHDAANLVNATQARTCS